MIIDCHVRLWSDNGQLGSDTSNALRAGPPPGWAVETGDPASLTRAMACVDAALVLGHRAALCGAHVPAELIADFVAREPRHRLGAAGIDPTEESAEQDLESALALGLVAVAISPALGGFHPAHSAAMRIYERCCDSGVPLIVTMPDPVPASAVLDFGRSVYFDEVARALPSLRILFTSVGFPWIDETRVLAGKHPNIYAEVSGVVGRPWQLYNTLSTAASLGVMDRLLLGSGFPQSTPEQAIEALYSVNTSVKGTPLPSVPRALIRQIVERDALEALGIDAPEVGRLESTTESLPESVEHDAL